MKRFLPNKSLRHFIWKDVEISPSPQALRNPFGLKKYVRLLARNSQCPDEYMGSHVSDHIQKIQRYIVNISREELTEALAE